MVNKNESNILKFPTKGKEEEKEKKGVMVF